VEVISADGRVRELPSKATFELGVGDRLRIETPGGGGFGSA
jgi:N-methylhydantoinase B/oxoprolinase/acetone carboxylase alpha subunit